jgi:hypothetical protein
MSLLASDNSNDGSQHVSMDHDSSPLAASLADDSQLIVVGLSKSPSNVGPPICTPSWTSSATTRQSTDHTSSSSTPSLPNASSSPLSLKDVTTTLDVQSIDASPSDDVQINYDTFHCDAQLLDDSNVDDDPTHSMFHLYLGGMLLLSPMYFNHSF